MASSTPGPYKTGLWEVSNPSQGDTVYLVDKTNLPPAGHGWRYYWIGNGNNTPGNMGWMHALITGAGDVGANIPVDSGDSGPLVQGPLANQILPYLSGSKPLRLKLPKEGLGETIAEVLSSPLVAIGVAPAIGGGASTLGSKGSSGVKKAIDTGKKVAAGLTLAALFTNPGLWGGIGMAILGTILILFGIVKLSGGNPTQVAKRVIA